MPNIVDEDVFDIVQEQLAENRKIARTRVKRSKAFTTRFNCM
ncbi:hypothetical protein [Wolbachia endosymbiont of Oedothorax gibbosus]|nr:hypothetical protein [Wolbachia endosymbiont of Oedothorax gibbosus]